MFSFYLLQTLIYNELAAHPGFARIDIGSLTVLNILRILMANSFFFKHIFFFHFRAKRITRGLFDQFGCFFKISFHEEIFERENVKITVIYYIL